MFLPETVSVRVLLLFTVNGLPLNSFNSIFKPEMVIFAFFTFSATSMRASVTVLSAVIVRGVSVRTVNTLSMTLVVSSSVSEYV